MYSKHLSVNARIRATVKSGPSNQPIWHIKDNYSHDPWLLYWNLFSSAEYLNQHTFTTPHYKLSQQVQKSITKVYYIQKKIIHEKRAFSNVTHLVQYYHIVCYNQYKWQSEGLFIVIQAMCLTEITSTFNIYWMDWHNILQTFMMPSWCIPQTLEILWLLL